MPATDGRYPGRTRVIGHWHDDASRAADCAALERMQSARPMKPPTKRLAERSISAAAIEAAKATRRAATDPVLTARLI